MATVREMRPKVRIAFAVLVGINVLAAGALAYMFVRGTSSLPKEFESLHRMVQNRKAAAVSPQTVTERIREAREQIAHFYEERFPNSSAALFESLGSVARENRVRLNQASYEINETDLPGLRQVTIRADLSGNYVEAMKFINSLERSKTFFVVNSVSLGDQKGGNVHLSVEIEAYMRGES